jgi:hypothetical protein
MEMKKRTENGINGRNEVKKEREEDEGLRRRRRRRRRDKQRIKKRDFVTAEDIKRRYERWVIN